MFGQAYAKTGDARSCICSCPSTQVFTYGMWIDTHTETGIKWKNSWIESCNSRVKRKQSKSASQRCMSEEITCCYAI